MTVSKNLLLFERDEKGDLIPQKFLVEGIGEILITPLTRGEIKKLFVSLEKDDDSDGKIILEHCHDPKFTVEEVKYLKPQFAKLIVNKILEESGVTIDEGGKKK